MASLQKRIDWLDVARAYGTILVIAGHLKLGVFSDWIYSFHLPLFFFISGYVFSAKRDFRSFVKRKIETLLIPYFFLIIPVILVASQHEEGLKTVLQNCYYALVQKRFMTVWFIAALFWVNIFFYGLVRLLKSPGKLIAASVVMALLGLGYYRLGGVLLPWNIDVSFTVMPFFCAGYCCKLKSDKFQSLLTAPKKAPALFFAAAALHLLCVVVSIRLTGGTLDLFSCTYNIAPLTYLSAFAGITWVMVFCMRFPFRSLAYIGRNCLIFFAWHQQIVMPTIVPWLAARGFAIVADAALPVVIAKGLAVTLIIMLILTPPTLLIYHTPLKKLVGK